MKKRIKSIRQQMMFYFCILIFSSVAVVVVLLCINTTKTVRDYTKEEVENSISQIGAGIDDMLVQSSESFSSIILNEKIITAMGQKLDIDRRDGFKKAYEIADTLRLLKRAYSYIESIYIYDIQNECYYSSYSTIINEPDFENTEIYNRFISKDKYLEWEVIRQIPGSQWKKDENYVTYALPVKNGSGQQMLGYIFVSIDIQTLQKALEPYQIADGQELFILSKNNEIIYAARGVKEQLQKTEMDLLPGSLEFRRGAGKYVALRQSKETGVKYGILISRKNYKMPIYRIWMIALICMLPILGFALFLSFVFSKKIYGPIRLLATHMESVVLVDKTMPLIEEKREDEFGSLYDSYNLMILGNRTLMSELEHEQEKQKNMQMQLFQEQMNPHFLYNTLNSIFCLSKIHKVQEIAELSEALIKFYRLSLNEGNTMISIQDTLEHMQYYVGIQNIRYKGRYRLKMYVQNDLYEQLIPKLIVQPLVENAIEHGLKDVKYCPDIVIRISRTEEYIIIQVQDYGQGIEAGRLRKIKAVIQGEVKEAEGLFALKNIRDRINLAYGSRAKLDVDSVYGEGTKVTITIPA